jgi:hypothetical protein
MPGEGDVDFGGSVGVDNDAERASCAGFMDRRVDGARGEDAVRSVQLDEALRRLRAPQVRGEESCAGDDDEDDSQG